jgi:hypothetical protein
MSASECDHLPCFATLRKQLNIQERLVVRAGSDQSLETLQDRRGRVLYVGSASDAFRFGKRFWHHSGTILAATTATFSIAFGRHAMQHA